jgi:hypothetical protein
MNNRNSSFNVLWRVSNHTDTDPTTEVYQASILGNYSPRVTMSQK